MSHSVNGKQLAQARPANTNAVSVYAPDTADMATEIRMINIANTTGSAATFRLFHDEDGTTYDETTALFFDKSIAANDSFTETYEEGAIWMRNTAGNLAFRTGTNNALTITVYGIEHFDTVGVIN